MTEPTRVEEWREVPGSDGLYEVSDLGRVRSNWRARPRVLRQNYNGNGYLHVTPCIGGRQRTVKVHHLVLAAFVGPKPAGLVVRHLNGNKSDNRLTNLAYGTQAENVQDTIHHGQHPCSSRMSCPQGHLYSAENTSVQSDGSRKCKTCHADRQRQRRARRRELV